MPDSKQYTAAWHWFHKLGTEFQREGGELEKIIVLPNTVGLNSQDLCLSVINQPAEEVTYHQKTKTATTLYILLSIQTLHFPQFF